MIDPIQFLCIVLFHLVHQKGKQVKLFIIFFIYLFSDVKSVGPLLAGPAKPLTDDLEEFVKGAGDKGVILVSFGSILGDIDNASVKAMAAVFSSVPQRVIWKINTGTQD